MFVSDCGCCWLICCWRRPVMAAARCDEVGCGSGGDEDDDVTFGVCLDDTCCCCWGSLNVKYLFDS